MIEDDPLRDLRRGLARILRGETPRTPAEWRTDYRILKWTTLASTSALIAALILWMGWSDFG